MVTKRAIMQKEYCHAFDEDKGGLAKRDQVGDSLPVHANMSSPAASVLQDQEI